MIDLAGFAFPSNRACIACIHVWEGHPVLLYIHDSDGDIQFYCAEDSHSMTDALVLGLGEMSSHLQSMQDMPAVEPGYCAKRLCEGEAWSVRKLPTG